MCPRPIVITCSIDNKIITWFSASMDVSQTSGSVVFPFGAEQNSTECLNVRDFIRNDKVVEETESLFFQINSTSPHGYDAITNGVVEVFVNDSDGMY